MKVASILRSGISLFIAWGLAPSALAGSPALVDFSISPPSPAQGQPVTVFIHANTGFTDLWEM